MAHEIKIPSVGESITSATLGTWHKAEGEYVRAGDILLTIETDKISTELESDRDGFLHHLAAVGDELAIGAPVAAIEEGGSSRRDRARAGSRREVFAGARPRPRPRISGECRCQSHSRRP